MSMEVPGVRNLGDYAEPAFPQQQRRQATSVHEERQQKPEIEVSVSELEKISTMLNHRLKFSINRDLERVVVKVIDSQTDKVIKELPPEEIQRLLVRIREALGVLIDELI